LMFKAPITAPMADPRQVKARDVTAQKGHSHVIQ